MKKTTMMTLPTLCRGITLVEILLGIGVLMVIMSFAMPSVTSASARAELRAAAENIDYSIRVARNTARMTESPVTMSLGEDGRSGAISFSSPSRRAQALQTDSLQPFTLPAEIQMVSTDSDFLFDQRGLISNPGSITLVHMDDTQLHTQITLE